MESFQKRQFNFKAKGSSDKNFISLAIEHEKQEIALNQEQLNSRIFDPFAICFSFLFNSKIWILH